MLHSRRRIVHAVHFIHLLVMEDASISNGMFNHCLSRTLQWNERMRIGTQRWVKQCLKDNGNPYFTSRPKLQLTTQLYIERVNDVNGTPLMLRSDASGNWGSEAYRVINQRKPCTLTRGRRMWLKVGTWNIHQAGKASQASFDKWKERILNKGIQAKYDLGYLYLWYYHIVKVVCVYVCVWAVIVKTLKGLNGKFWL